MSLGAEECNDPVVTDPVKVSGEGEGQAVNEDTKSPQVSAREFKEVGDVFYKKQDFRRAMDSYSQAISKYPSRWKYLHSLITSQMLILSRHHTMATVLQPLWHWENTTMR
jgi:hypothetical protein